MDGNSRPAPATINIWSRSSRMVDRKSTRLNSSHLPHPPLFRSQGEDADKKLTCKDAHGDGWELKTGTSDDQHLVSIEPHGSGTRFGTVLIRTHVPLGAPLRC